MVIVLMDGHVVLAKLISASAKKKKSSFFFVARWFFFWFCHLLLVFSLGLLGTRQPAIVLAAIENVHQERTKTGRESFEEIARKKASPHQRHNTSQESLPALLGIESGGPNQTVAGFSKHLFKRMSLGVHYVLE